MVAHRAFRYSRGRKASSMRGFVLSGFLALLALLLLLPFGEDARACDHVTASGNAVQQEMTDSAAHPGIATGHRAAAQTLGKSAPAPSGCTGGDCCLAHCLTVAPLNTPPLPATSGRPVLTLSAHTLWQGLSPAPDHGPPRLSL
jgi:hypothetical protein